MHSFSILFRLGFPAAAYAAYAAGRGYSGYPSFGLPYPTGKCGSLPNRHNHNHIHNLSCVYTHSPKPAHTDSYSDPVVHLYVSESVKQSPVKKTKHITH